VYERAKADIAASRKLVDDMQRLGHIGPPPRAMLDEALEWAVARARA
jgi:hypothetical protein